MSASKLLNVSSLICGTLLTVGSVPFMLVINFLKAKSNTLSSGLLNSVLSLYSSFSLSTITTGCSDTSAPSTAQYVTFVLKNDPLMLNIILSTFVFFGTTI